MNCKKFQDMLYLYVAEELSEELKKQMEEHLSDCEECNELYNEELFIKASIIGALDLDNIVFESQKDKIMNSIDKNKYSETYTNHRADLSRFIKYFKIGMPVAAAIAFVLLLNPIERFKLFENRSSSISSKDTGSIHTEEKPTINSTNDSAKTTNEQENISKKADMALNKEKTNETNIDNSANEKVALNHDNNVKEKISNDSIKRSDDKLEVKEDNEKNLDGKDENSLALAGEKQNENNSSTENLGLQAGDNTIAEQTDNIDDLTNNIYYEKENDINVRFNKKLYMDDPITKVASGWIESPNKQFQSLIKVNDVYLDKIYIKDTSRNIVWSIEKDNNPTNSIPKFVEWYDNESIFVVMNGTEDNVKKEELYLLDVAKGNGTMLYKLYGGSKSIVGINKINTTNVELKLQLNSNDNYLDSNMQSFTLLDIRKENFYK
ncbi:hypothetical protein CLHOM_19470 [Clostridium homopropionicum DSM 5847]|uniref:Anti-sigma-W factor RsiW n=1 Tax=Clostridium homopropionicum DSM 5847 TaxID=1121318 RepID=A0A0L6ZAP5_9CLOT|nr:DUF4652 domain-containing protein [Clostridium homopropionicum]KOA19858.1 hypothetical protein CLHOM_19470 [Clostridium homopropionicum DSM 5847]SFF75919.1 Putative zinc-finger [Clostridium homopropionicum]